MRSNQTLAGRRQLPWLIAEGLLLCLAAAEDTGEGLVEEAEGGWG